MTRSGEDWTDFFNIFLTSFRTIEGNTLDLKVVSNSFSDSSQTSELEIRQRQIDELNSEVCAPILISFTILKHGLEGDALPSIK